MTVNKGKKSRKQRGSRTCGWGLCHRDSGQRGGFGNAGSGKKAKCKMPRRGLWAIQTFGKFGFKPKGPVTAQNPLNVEMLECRIDQFVAETIAKIEKDTFVIDLMDAGYNKLLGSGKVSRKFRVITPFASKSAIEKIKAAGGEVIIQKSVQEAKVKGNEQ